MELKHIELDKQLDVVLETISKPTLNGEYSGKILTYLNKETGIDFTENFESILQQLKSDKLIKITKDFDAANAEICSITFKGWYLIEKGGV